MNGWYRFTRKYDAAIAWIVAASWSPHTLWGGYYTCGAIAGFALLNAYEAWKLAKRTEEIHVTISEFQRMIQSIEKETP
jgi:hypothetical protein